MGQQSCAPKKTSVPDDVNFKTKPQIALDLIDRAKANGIRVMAWNADEFYGRDGKFLDGLDERGEAFVVEVQPNTHVWLRKPKVLKNQGKPKPGRPKRPRHLRKRDQQSSEVQNLARHSPEFYDQPPQRYVTKNTHKGEDVWEIRWATCWRKTHTDALISKQCTLIVATNVLTKETKYFLSNQVPGRRGWTLRMILRVAFGRWPVEDCFREAKEELGLDHFECRSWHGIHRHLYLTILSHLFCARVREKFSKTDDVMSGELLTTEQVRRAMNVYLDTLDLPLRCRLAKHNKELEHQQYYQRRNAKAAEAHRKKRRDKLAALGIDVTSIKSLNDKGKS
jgi:SRSO17 transposase